MQVVWGIWTRIRFVLGYLLNGVGWPGIVAPGDYRAEVTHAIVRVRLDPLFTVVTVNGVDVYFHRLTGRIDGVGVSPTGDCRGDATRG
jgi:hypothetical protein